MNDGIKSPPTTDSIHPDIALIVVNYRTKAYIIKLLGSFLIHETYAWATTFYIGDNHSGDDLSDLSQLFPKLTIKTFQLTENRGFGAANNALSQHTNEPILFFVNPDIEWTCPILNILSKKIANNAKYAVVGPKLQNKDGSTQQWDHGESKGFLAKWALSSGFTLYEDRDCGSEVAWISWAACMVRSDTFREVQWFDETFFLYREEEDMCLRIRKQWGKIWYEPSVSIVHIGSVVAKIGEHLAKSHKWYMAKHHPFITRTRMYAFNCWIIWGLFTIFQKCKKWFWGIK